MMQAPSFDGEKIVADKNTQFPAFGLAAVGIVGLTSSQPYNTNQLFKIPTNLLYFRSRKLRMWLIVNLLVRNAPKTSHKQHGSKSKRHICTYACMVFL
jgi:hypothetical protein